MDDFAGEPIDIFVHFWWKRDETHQEGAFGKGLIEAANNGSNLNQAWVAVKKFFMSQELPPSEWFEEIEQYYVSDFKEQLSRDFCLYLVRKYRG